jgi:uncharacterized membrane protein
MPIISQTLHIDAPHRRVFRCLVGDLARLREWWEALKQHEVISGTPRYVGSRLRYSYMLHGIRLKGIYEVVDFVPSRYLFVRTLSGINAVIEIVIDDEGDHSVIDLAINYALPGTLLGSSTHRPALEAQLEQDISTMLHHLKAAAEGGSSTAQKDSHQS